MNTVKTANFTPVVALSKDIFTHESVAFHVVKRKATRGEKIITTKTIGHYKKGQVYEVSDYNRQEVLVKKDEGLIPVFHSEYSVLVPMIEAKPLPTSVYSPSTLNQLESSGTPIFNWYNHTVLDFGEVEDGHTLVMKLPAGDHITVCGMIMRDRKDVIVDIQYHGENGQQMIGFTPNGTPRVQEDRIKHNLYCLDLRASNKEEPYGSYKDLSYRRLDEVIMDISIQVGAWIALNQDKMPDGYDSRRLLSEIHDWAVEFEKKFGTQVRDDYYNRVDRFTQNKISQWAKEYTE